MGLIYSAKYRAPRDSKYIKVLLLKLKIQKLENLNVVTVLDRTWGDCLINSFLRNTLNLFKIELN